MIARTNRFHGRASLRYVYQRGTTVRGPILSLKYVFNPKRNAYRLAVVVSKKVNKSAVSRNRMRRRIYEVIRQLNPPIVEAYDMVITVFHEQLLELSSPKLEQMIKAQLKQADIIKGKKPTTGPND